MSDFYRLESHSRGSRTFSNPEQTNSSQNLKELLLEEPMSPRRRSTGILHRSRQNNETFQYGALHRSLNQEGRMLVNTGLMWTISNDFHESLRARFQSSHLSSIAELSASAFGEPFSGGESEALSAPIQVRRHLNLLWVFISCGYMVAFTAVGSLIAYFKATQGANFYTYMYCVFYLPGLPVSMLQQRYDQGFDERLGSQNAFFVRVTVGMVVQAVLLCVLPFLEPWPAATLSAMGVIGAASWICHGTACQLCAMFPPSSTAYLQTGFRTPELYALGAVYALNLDTDATEFHVAILYYTTALWVVVGTVAWIAVVGSKPATVYFKLKDLCSRGNGMAGGGSGSGGESSNSNLVCSQRVPQTPLSSTTTARPDPTACASSSASAVPHAVRHTSPPASPHASPHAVAAAAAASAAAVGARQVGQRETFLAHPSSKSSERLQISSHGHSESFDDNFSCNEDDKDGGKADGKPGTPAATTTGSTSTSTSSGHLNSSSSCKSNNNNNTSGRGVESKNEDFFFGNIDGSDDDEEEEQGHDLLSVAPPSPPPPLPRLLLPSEANQVMRGENNQIKHARDDDDDDEEEDEEEEESVDAVAATILPCRVAIFTNIWSSIFTAAFYVYVPTTGGPLFGPLGGPKVGNVEVVLYFVRLFSDLLGRPVAALQRPKCLATKESLKNVSTFRVVLSVTFFLYILQPGPSSSSGSDDDDDDDGNFDIGGLVGPFFPWWLRIPHSDFFIVVLVGVYSALSGYLNVLAYEYAAGALRTKQGQSAACTLMNTTFQLACFVAVAMSVAIVALLFN